MPRVAQWEAAIGRGSCRLAAPTARGCRAIRGVGPTRTAMGGLAMEEKVAEVAQVDRLMGRLVSSADAAVDAEAPQMAVRWGVTASLLPLCHP